MKRRCLALLAAFALSIISVESHGLTLVGPKQVDSRIVIADKPSRSARMAASELQMWLRKITDVEVPIVPESRLAEKPAGTLILVGDTKRGRALGIDPAEFELEELRIRAFPDTLVLIGDDERPDGLPLNGTLWAVETFVENHLGVRVMWPGPIGEIVPKQRPLEVPADLSNRYIPPLRQRRIRNLGYSDRIQRGLDKLGWSEEAYKRHSEEAEPWFRFHRIGGSFRGSYGHAYGDYWERFHESHPDWFALQPDGTRDNSRAEGGHRARLCVSNPGLIQQVARDAIERLKRNPILDTVSISPNDGSGGATFCVCEKCESWDAPEGRPVDIRRSGKTIQHVSLSDRFVRFYAGVAKIVAKEMPDRYVGAYAYSVYKSPPIRATLPANVVIGFVPNSDVYLNEDLREEMRSDWREWSGKAKHLFLRPNWLRAGMGFPTCYVHRMGEDIRYFAEHGMLITDFDCCEHEWAGDGLNYYVLARLLWNPKQDVDDVIQEYCQLGFGPKAGATVRAYFQHLEDMTTELASERSYQGRKINPDVLARMYTDAFFEKANALLDEAAREAEGNDRILARIGFLKTPLEYARIRRDWVLAKAAVRDGDREAQKRVRSFETERQEWYQKLGLSWALHAPHLQYYGY